MSDDPLVPPDPGAAIAQQSQPASTPPEVSAPPSGRPKYVFLGVVAALGLLLDIGTKAWAEIALSARPFHDPSMDVIPGHLTFTLAYNKGGAWGLLQDSNELVRLPFFLAVSVIMIWFIVALYGKLGPGQTALKWALPLVLGGALGNLSDRITRSSVIDFIDYRGDWVLAMNRGIARLSKGWTLTDHWPTFNVADIGICAGVGLMAIDMFTARRGHTPRPS